MGAYRMAEAGAAALLLLALVLFVGQPVQGAGAAEPRPTTGVAMHGEPKYPADFTHFDYVNPNAPKGGMVRLAAIGSTFDTFNPFTLKGVPAAGSDQVFETLMANSEDEAFSEYGLLAESIEMPEDRSWVAFTLRPNARWQDGKPVTVEDVLFSLHILKTEGRPFYRFYYANIKKAEKVGPRKVKFTFGGGQNRELPLIAGQLPILPKHFFEGRDFSKTILKPIPGSGPYRIKDFEPGRSVTYELVKDYWGRDIPVNKGRYNFGTIRYDYYRDGTIALEAFKAGDYDFRAENTSKLWATGYDSPARKEGLYKLEQIPNEIPTGMQGFVFNTRKSIFKDPRVRRALAYAFDFEWTNKNLFYGQYTRTESYFSNSELASRGLPSKEELKILEPYRSRIPDEVFTKVYKAPETDGSGRIRDNLKIALKLLQEAGWRIKDRKLVNAQGQPFQFEMLLVSPAFERVVLPFKRNLARLGIDMSVRTVDTSQYQKRIDNFDFDMVVSSFGQSLSPGNEQREFWGSQAADRPGSRNIIGIKDPVVDALINKVISAPDRESLIMRTRALDRVLLWGFYVIPHWHIRSFRVAYWNKFGHPAHLPKYGFAFDAWWVDPTKAARLESRKGAASGK